MCEGACGDGRPLTATEQHMLEVIRRTHSGRWPTWRAYGMRRSGLKIYEVAKRRAARDPEPYCVITWYVAEIRLSWRSFPTLRAAREHMRTLS